MSDFKYYYNCRDDAKLRAAFHAVSKRVFRVDFERWYQTGLWPDNYDAIVVLDGDTPVAGIGVYETPLYVDGRMIKAAQLGCVGVHPDYRKRGLSRLLMEAVFKKYRERVDFIYLFTGQDNRDFYPLFGFQKHPMQHISINTEGMNACGTARLLDMNEKADFDLLMHVARSRYERDNPIGIRDFSAVLAWRVLSMANEQKYYLPEQDAIVISRSKQAVIEIVDVISIRPMSFSAVWNAVGNVAATSCTIRFTPDFIDAPEYCIVDEPYLIFYGLPLLELPHTPYFFTQSQYV